MMGLLRKSGNSRRISGKTVALLDVGSAKTVCLLVRLGQDAEVVGWGVTGSPGIKAAEVADPQLAVRAIAACIHRAEKMAQVSVTQVGVQIGCGRLRSEVFAVHQPLAGRVPDAAAQAALLEKARFSLLGQQGDAGAVRTLHLEPVSYQVDDGEPQCALPQTGGQVLSGVFHAVLADAAPVEALLSCVRQCGVEPAILAAAPFASASAVLSAQEADDQAVVVDIGAGTTSLAIFARGTLIHVDALAIGGNHVTQAIARHFNVSFEDAEHLKLALGEPVTGGGMDAERMAVFEAIRPGIVELFQLLDARMRRAGLPSLRGGRVVLTGGGSRLAQLPDLAQAALPGCQIERREPTRFRGFPDLPCGASFAGISGLVQVRGSQLAGESAENAAPVAPEAPQAAVPKATEQGGAGVGLGRWLRDSF